MSSFSEAINLFLESASRREKYTEIRAPRTLHAELTRKREGRTKETRGENTKRNYVSRK